jgi:hypothetical protein
MSRTARANASQRHCNHHSTPRTTARVGAGVYRGVRHPQVRQPALLHPPPNPNPNPKLRGTWSLFKPPRCVMAGGKKRSVVFAAWANTYIQPGRSSRIPRQTLACSDAEGVKGVGAAALKMGWGDRPHRRFYQCQPEWNLDRRRGPHTYSPPLPLTTISHPPSRQNAYTTTHHAQIQTQGRAPHHSSNLVTGECAAQCAASGFEALRVRREVAAIRAMIPVSGCWVRH